MDSFIKRGSRILLKRGDNLYQGILFDYSKFSETICSVLIDTMNGTPTNQHIMDDVHINWIIEVISEPL